MVTDNRNEQERACCRYYDLRDAPVRVVLDATDRPFGADRFSAQTNSFERDASLLSSVDVDPFCDEISAETFYALCADLHREATS